MSFIVTLLLLVTLILSLDVIVSVDAPVLCHSNIVASVCADLAGAERVSCFIRHPLDVVQPACIDGSLSALAIQRCLGTVPPEAMQHSHPLSAGLSRVFSELITACIQVCASTCAVNRLVLHHAPPYLCLLSPYIWTWLDVSVHALLCGVPLLVYYSLIVDAATRGAIETKRNHGHEMIQPTYPRRKPMRMQLERWMRERDEMMERASKRTLSLAAHAPPSSIPYPDILSAAHLGLLSPHSSEASAQSNIFPNDSDDSHTSEADPSFGRQASQPADSGAPSSLPTASSMANLSNKVTLTLTDILTPVSSIPDSPPTPSNDKSPVPMPLLSGGKPFSHVDSPEGKPGSGIEYPSNLDQTKQYSGGRGSNSSLDLATVDSGLLESSVDVHDASYYDNVAKSSILASPSTCSGLASTLPSTPSTPSAPLTPSITPSSHEFADYASDYFVPKGHQDEVIQRHQSNLDPMFQDNVSAAAGQPEIKSDASSAPDPTEELRAVLTQPEPPSIVPTLVPYPVQYIAAPAQVDTQTMPKLECDVFAGQFDAFSASSHTFLEFLAHSEPTAPIGATAAEMDFLLARGVVDTSLWAVDRTLAMDDSDHLKRPEYLDAIFV